MVQLTLKFPLTMSKRMQLTLKFPLTMSKRMQLTLEFPLTMSKRMQLTLKFPLTMQVGKSLSLPARFGRSRSTLVTKPPAPGSHLHAMLTMANRTSISAVTIAISTSLLLANV